MNPSIFIRKKEKQINFKIYNSLIFEDEKIKAQKGFFFVMGGVL